MANYPDYDRNRENQSRYRDRDYGLSRRRGDDMRGGDYADERGYGSSTYETWYPGPGGAGWLGSDVGYYGSYPDRGYGDEGGYGDYGGYGRFGTRGYTPSRRDYQRSRYGGGSQRDFWDRAGDEVASWFGDDAAQQRREMDEHRGKGPRGYQRSDDRITEDVNDRLTDDPALDASDVQISVSEAEVTLNGQVASRWAKRRAEDCADSVSGVRHVQNNLRVRETDRTAAAE